MRRTFLGGAMARVEKQRGVSDEAVRPGLGFVALYGPVLGILHCGLSALAAKLSDRPLDWPLLLLTALSYGLWALWTRPIMRMTRARPFVDGKRWRVGAIYLAVGLGFFLVNASVYALGRQLVTAPPPPGTDPLSAAIADLLTVGVVLHLAIFGAIVGTASGVASYRRLREEESRRARFEVDFVHARLDALRSQLNPHALFNTLHTIAAMISVAPERAESMVVRLGDFLRRVMDLGDQQEVALSSELEVLSSYLAIEQARFGERLEVEVNVSLDCLAALVPTLILQPLVENAIKHGVARSDGRGQVEIAAVRLGRILRLEVVDNGAGPAELSGRRGVGLANTRERLQRLYGELQAFELEPATGGGARVRLRFPFHVAEETGAASETPQTPQLSEGTVATTR